MEGSGEDVLLLSDSLAGSVEPIRADDAHDEEVVGRAETAGGKVALRMGIGSASFFCCQLAMETSDKLTLYCTGS